MKFECIVHPPATVETGYFFTQLRREYWEICQGCETEFNSPATRACAAKLLHYFENWMNSKLASRAQSGYLNSTARLGGHPDDADEHLWVYGQTVDLLVDHLLEHKSKIVKQALNWLVSIGYLYRQNNPTFAWDKCYQYQINVALVQSKIDAISFDAKQKTAETQQYSKVPHEPSLIPQEPRWCARNQHIKDSTKKNQIKESKKAHDAIDQQSRAVCYEFDFEEFSHGEVELNPPIGRKEKTDPEPNQPNQEAESIDSSKDKKQSPLPGHKSIGEDLNGAAFSAKKEKRMQLIDGALHEVDKKGYVVLPRDGKFKLPHAITMKRLQVWLYEQLAEDGFKLAQRDGEVWGFSRKDSEWLHESEMRPVRELLSYAEHYNCPDLAENFNSYAVSMFSNAIRWCGQQGDKALSTLEKVGTVRLFELEWLEELEDEEDESVEC